MTDRDPDFDLPLERLMPLAALLGMETVPAEAGEVRVRLAWSERLASAGGILHGGAIMALADTAGAWCAVRHLPPGATGTVTTDSTTRFFGSVRDGDGYVEAVARVLHAGRTIIAVDIEVRDGSGRLVARTSQAQLVFRPR